jgi:lipopolysaccharide export LptBFGC system permease protein LptF
MIAFGSMAHHSEIVAINSHGLGIKKIISLILIQTFLLASIFTYLGNALSPSLTSHAYEVKNSALLKSNSNNELWFKGQDLIVHAKSIITAKHLKFIEIYYVNDGVMTSTVSAKKAEYYNNNWNLIDAEITDITNNRIFKKKSLYIPTDEFIPFQIIKSSFNIIQYKIFMKISDTLIIKDFTMRIIK